MLVVMNALEFFLRVEEEPQQPLVHVGDALPCGVSLTVQLQQVPERRQEEWQS